MIKELVAYIVRQLVDNPDQVRVEVHQDDGKENLEIIVDLSDRGKVIGRQGQTIKAIRALVTALSPQDKKFTVDIS